jgi:hypothetical protein
MNVEIGTEALIFLFWEYLFQIFGILSLQCKRAQITLVAFAKGNLLPFGLLCMRNPRIVCNADHVLPYR